MSLDKGNPALYRKLQEPLPVAEAQANLERFWEGVYALRESCHLADVHLIVRTSVVYEEGHEADPMMDGHIGNSMLGESMTAWSFGRQSAQRQASIAAAVNDAVRAIKQPKDRK